MCLARCERSLLHLGIHWISSFEVSVAKSELTSAAFVRKANFLNEVGKLGGAFKCPYRGVVPESRSTWNLSHWRILVVVAATPLGLFRGRRFGFSFALGLRNGCQFLAK